MPPVHQEPNLEDPPNAPGARRPRLRAMLVAAAWLLAAAAPLRAAADGADAPVVVTQAEFASGRDATQWQPVTLPDTWARRGLPPKGFGRYRATVVLPAAPRVVWGLRIDRLSTHHEVRVNATPVHGSLAVPPATLRRPVPSLLTIPPGLLRAGANLIEIDVDNGTRAGLSALELGPLPAIEAEFIVGHHRAVQLPQLLNMLSAGTCLVGLLVWWRRRGETALGTFGALGLLASVRNLGYYGTASALPGWLTDWLFFAAQVVSVLLLGRFALALAGRRPRHLLRGLVGIGAALLALGAAGVAADRMVALRALVYPVLLASVAAALVLIGSAVRRLPGATLAAVLAGLALVLGAGVHDYLYQLGRTSVMDGYWLPYTVPVAVMAFTAWLVKRVVDAMHEVEQLNDTLERRVHERTLGLEAANAAKRRFIAAASHDLRQPLAAVGLMVGLLREQVTTPRLQHLAARVDEAVASMEELLKGLLDLSRLESGTVQARPARIELQPLFDRIAAHEADAARARGLTLRLRPTPLAALSDPVLLEQILRNLVNNAVKYTDRGGVLVGARRRGDRVLLQVCDSGRGIAPERLPQVFEEFVQLDAPRAAGGVRGLGLGLAIVQRAAQLLGHRLSLRSVPGRGSCFCVELPLDRRAAARAAGSLSGDRPLAGLRVLVVEDEPAVREALQGRLEQWGAEVLGVDGLAALRDALADPAAAAPDLLLTDQRLPDGSGIEAVARVRARFPAVPVLVVTGNTLPDDLARLRDAGLPVLHKPFRADALLRAIAAVRALPQSPGT